MVGKKRRYRKKKRARSEKETRERIAAAAVELHRTLGPAATGVKDVAELAGVSRTTVYSHYPTETDLFVACSTHWASANPFPDPEAWGTIEDPARRLAIALEQLYEWYGLKRDMLEKVLRDTAVVPALAEVMDGLWSPYMDRIVAVLARGWEHDRGASAAGQAALRLSVDFQSWKTLSDAGLDDHGAGKLAARMAMAVLNPR